MIVILGAAGNGKSKLANRLTGREGHFPESASADAETKVTVSLQAGLAGDAAFPVEIVDTPGLDESDAADTAHLAQFRDTMLAKGRLDALVITLNAQAPRFVAATARLMRMLFSMFCDDPSFWDNTCIVFTRCYPGHHDRAALTSERGLRSKVLAAMVEATPGVAPRLPCFFFELGSALTDAVNHADFEEFRHWLVARRPVSTASIREVRGDFKHVTTEVQDVVVSTVHTPIYSTKARGGIAGAFGGTKTYQSGTRTTQTWQKQQRTVSTRWDDSVSYGDWTVVRTWTTRDGPPECCVC